MRPVETRVKKRVEISGREKRLIIFLIVLFILIIAGIVSVVIVESESNTQCGSAFLNGYIPSIGPKPSPGPKSCFGCDPTQPPYNPPPCCAQKGTTANCAL